MGSVFNDGLRCGEDFLALADAQQAELLKTAIIDNDIIRISSLIEEVLGEIVDNEVYDSLWIEGLKKAMKFSTKGKKDMGADRGIEILSDWVDRVGVIPLRDLVKQVISQTDHTNIFDQFRQIVESCDDIYSRIPKEGSENAPISKEISEAFEAYLMAIGEIAFHDALPTDEALYYSQLEREDSFYDEDGDDDEDDYQDEDAAWRDADDDSNIEYLMTDLSDHFIPGILKPFLRKTNAFLKVIGKQ